MAQPHGSAPSTRQGYQGKSRAFVALVHAALSIGCAVGAVADHDSTPFASPLRPDSPTRQRDRSDDNAAFTEQPDEPLQADDAAVCRAVLQPRFARRPLNYPGGGRLQLGSATIVVRYIINERGETENASVAVVYERSDASRPQYFDLFATAAKNEVKRYRYKFIGVPGKECSRRQQRMTVFEFKTS